MPKGIHPRPRPVGFLKPWFWHRVHIRGIGITYEGRNKREALRACYRITDKSRITYTVDDQTQTL